MFYKYATMYGEMETYEPRDLDNPAYNQRELSNPRVFTEPDNDLNKPNHHNHVHLPVTQNQPTT